MEEWFVLPEGGDGLVSLRSVRHGRSLTTDSDGTVGTSASNKSGGDRDDDSYSSPTLSFSYAPSSSTCPSPPPLSSDSNRSEPESVYSLLPLPLLSLPLSYSEPELLSEPVYEPECCPCFGPLRLATRRAVAATAAMRCCAAALLRCCCGFFTSHDQTLLACGYLRAYVELYVRVEAIACSNEG